MQHRLSKTTLGLALTLALYSASTFAQLAEQIKIAVVGPTTTNMAQYGDMQVLGAQTAIEMINAQGGINGTPLKAVLFDDACNAEQAVKVADRIVSEKIDYVIGHLCSSATQAASRIYDEHNILMITAASTSPAITEQGYPRVFRTIGLDSDQGPTAARYISEEIQPERVAILHDQLQYGLGLARSVRDQLRALGTQVVLFEPVSPGETDFTDLITELQQRKVDLVYYGGYHPELMRVLRQAAELGLKTQFMGPEGVANKDLSAYAGPAAEGLLVTMPKKFHLNPANQGVVEEISQKNQDASGPFIWTAYAAVQSIAAALGSGANTPSEAAVFLHSHPVDTVMGELAWNPEGDLTDFHFGIYRWHADGTSTLLRN